ncbi:inositol oxygenase 4-like [Arachis ipaensis]|uniref:inositol oxygenase 4-like n=1 Tax=Arachis ipaensis TaxID=130454 RepID=UPI0007AFC97C|nr:inositol oxygenase 4-like [Arachis ipaensis]
MASANNAAGSSNNPRSFGSIMRRMNRNRDARLPEWCECGLRPGADCRAANEDAAVAAEAATAQPLAANGGKATLVPQPPPKFSLNSRVTESKSAFRLRQLDEVSRKDESEFRSATSGMNMTKEVCYVHQFFSKLTLIMNIVTISPKRHDQLRVAQANNVANLIANDQIVTDIDQSEISLLTRLFGRDYDIESERQKGVEEFYRLQHINQTYDFVKKMREHYKKLDKAEMNIWECCELLNEVVDDSDPDLDEPQIQHLLQTAEAIRKDYPNEDWLHLTALIHDLGKILHLPQFGELPQWAVVGDTFPVGCAFDEKNVHHKYFKENPDSKNPAYNTKDGVYSKGCGLDNVLMSWGHDDYMYMVAKENGTTLPSPGLFIIRYHSFYPLHKEGAYTHLMSEEDFENLKWLHIFNKYDLYSKSKVLVDVKKVKPYYQSLIDKYFPAKLYLIQNKLTIIFFSI